MPDLVSLPGILKWELSLALLVLVWSLVSLARARSWSLRARGRAPNVVSLQERRRLHESRRAPSNPLRAVVVAVAFALVAGSFAMALPSVIRIARPERGALAGADGSVGGRGGEQHPRRATARPTAAPESEAGVPSEPEHVPPEGLTRTVGVGSESSVEGGEASADVPVAVESSTPSPTPSPTPSATPTAEPSPTPTPSEPEPTSTPDPEDESTPDPEDESTP
ncbi:MAG TPA: hypothetical protein VHK89_07400 [Actinomycetota bacterium]|nr:hypothetical protein [Actinomycetota bacterium]